ncbi:MAG: FMN-binding negative transcriptional regulator [Pseudomonadota bacterium]|nr:FMN-binding negative transcriptional regulator [Pseudomonadota bacterium]
MYEPPLHRQNDLAAIHALIRAHPLALLVSHGPSGLLANAIPFTLVEDGSRFGLLRCHLARANPQGRDLAEGAQALVVFQGANHYITPSWYATKRDTGKVVPTWNYVMAQARGTARVVESPDWLRAQVEQLTREREAARAEPWAVSDAPEDFVAQQLRAIVGVEIVLTDLRGKWKASQNRPPADREGVVEGLGDHPMAGIVRGG